ncbi:FapA family protein [Alteromonas sp. C1M14]|uniref:DUF342 domain-containing protein n=1 Tax=Alteromonas sp. C1M14 TaxID=2841567 RepID=UPI001C096A15|nr:FapA family protein [Alteromonas sp. C1M14]MBU2978982.1 FapA family protein [Alteromonas sp. C1M14]
MKGISYNYNNDTQYLSITVLPSEMEQDVDTQSIIDSLKDTPYADFYVSKRALKTTCDKANLAFKTGDTSAITAEIAQLRHAEVEFIISEDALSASLRLTAPYGGKMPNAITIRNLAYKNRIRRGVGLRHIEALLTEAAKVEPGDIVEGVIAKGLPAKNGKNSRFIPLVPNALERVLKPKTDDSSKSDLRNLGDIICVKVGTPVLRRTAPTQGRKGFDVKDTLLIAKPGKWLDFKMGMNTVVSDDDDNILIAKMSGMPKYHNLKMDIDETFICNGVNVGTGHVTYEGAILVNGDVAEKMIVKATKDITINGFVESAIIEAGGDIIITEGAMGKVVEDSEAFSCTLIAGGSIHIQHGQGIDLKAKGDITVARQLAYSRIHSGGGVTVGQLDKPMGNLFACDLTCQDKVEAGTLGAVAGSTLKVDFSPGLAVLTEKKDTIDDLLRHLRENNLRHKEKLALINQRLTHKDLASKVSEVKAMLHNETALLFWLEKKSLELQTRKDDYLANIKLKANKRLYSGVSAKLNNRNWRSERELERCEIRYDAHKWHYHPIID